MPSPIKSPDSVVEGMREAKIENGDSDEGSMLEAIVVEARVKDEEDDEKGPSVDSPSRLEEKRTSGSLGPDAAQSTSENVKSEDEEVIGGEITVKMEPGQTPKLARSSTQKVPARTAKLFDHLPDATPEAIRTFQMIEHCTYTPKYLGDTEHAMECDCAEEWDSSSKMNLACGEDSDCINRATKMECIGDCGCGTDCLNQRFQQKEYGDVSVIKTEKKGHGLRTNADLQPGQFIYEYIGEVINETQFRKRMLHYDDEGIKHFYFMSLTRGEFVDATKRGNLGRFCNHSCNPNCYVDKWVVGNKLRMGIFAERKIKAGEELVFNYNVDRYGADPQPCYCGEPNCTGFIGGKTQTERATKLSMVVIEALGIDDGDGWDTAVAKRPRKKRANEDDEEYVNNVQPKPLDEEGVTKVMASLLQNKEKWITVKLLNRIEQSDDERIINRVVRMHGYQILKSVLAAWKEDVNIVLQVFNILDNFPRLTKNKITDSKIESTVENLLEYEDEAVRDRAGALLQEWSQLETAYRIPRKKRDPNAPVESQVRADWRDSRNDKSRRSRSRSKSPSKSPPRGPAIPSGPRGSHSQRQFFQNSRPPFRPPRPFNALPDGWFAASSNGRTYYYTSTGETQWKRPTAPSSRPAPPPPPKAINATKKLDDLINEITSAKPQTPEKASASGTPKPASEEAKPERKQNSEKWKSYSEEKQKKIYENTLFPHVKSIVDKYRKQLPKEDCKRFFKEVSKKLVNSDFKNGRVEDPAKISEKQLKNMRKYVKEFFDKAVAKNKEREIGREKKKAGKTQIPSSKGDVEEPLSTDKIKQEGSDFEVMDVSEDDQEKVAIKHSESPATPLEATGNGETHKRKRENGADDRMDQSEVPGTPSKRIKSESPPSPPPPPPPPPETTDFDEMTADGEDLLESKLVDEQDDMLLEKQVMTEPKMEDATLEAGG